MNALVAIININDMKEKLLKILLDRSTDLERRRTKALATQQWATVIEVEAQIHENALIRKQLTELAQRELTEPVTPKEVVPS